MKRTLRATNRRLDDVAGSLSRKSHPFELGVTRTFSGVAHIFFCNWRLRTPAEGGRRHGEALSGAKHGPIAEQGEISSAMEEPRYPARSG
jgi:hypothetical protein